MLSCCLLQLLNPLAGSISFQTQTIYILKAILSELIIGKSTDTALQSTNIAASILIFFLLFVSCTFSLFYCIDKVGRRTILLCSLAIILFSWLIILTLISIHAYYMQLYPLPAVTTPLWLLSLQIGSILSLAVLTAAYGAGLSLVTWTYSFELFPLRARSRAAALSTFSFFFSISLSHHLLDHCRDMQLYSILYIFCIFSVVLWIFVYLFVPETTGIVFTIQSLLCRLNSMH